MGSSQRFNYTILGDAANLASRLEGANKAFGTYTMISEATWQQTQGAFAGRRMGRIRVVGRRTPVTIYEALGFQGEHTAMDVVTFEAALLACEAGKWCEAADQFEAFSDDPVALRYAAKCRTLDETPGGTWDGIWNLSEK